ncbi:hypothetical protein LSH36_184g04007 [Paralvinella palmiformis]|uniref:Uncharacterized protein n=1 Tax=Paralvinella palmiformis TaxID=53620 RepID=A0AAD9JQZ2_9ANNE|nr:hypothetical protein LSH36_184g04007 [Paralvinella palmiformis]
MIRFGPFTEGSDVQQIRATPRFEPMTRISPAQDVAVLVLCDILIRISPLMMPNLRSAFDGDVSPVYSNSLQTSSYPMPLLPPMTDHHMCRPEGSLMGSQPQVRELYKMLTTPMDTGEIPDQYGGPAATSSTQSDVIALDE